MEEDLRIYCIQLRPVGEVLPDVIRIRADTMCHRSNRKQYNLKRDGEVVGSFVGDILAWWIEEITNSESN